MKVLVVSDSHSGLSFMRHALYTLKPDVMIHLGDYVDDGAAMAEEFPGVRYLQVAGNCDRMRMTNAPEVLQEKVAGVRFFLSHGHLHGVKTYPDKFILDAQKNSADVALYGHTHCADCRQTESGMWVMNPGSCGSWSGTVGYVEIEAGKVTVCRILQEADMEKII